MDEQGNWNVSEAELDFCTNSCQLPKLLLRDFVLTPSTFFKQFCSVPHSWLAGINCIMHVNGTSESSWHLLVQRNTSEEPQAESQIVSELRVSCSHGALLLEQSMQKDGT